MTLPSGLPENVLEDEPMARFLRSSSHVAKSTGRIKYGAYLPAPDDDTSVFRREGLDDVELKKLGAEYVPNSVKHGSALILAKVIIDEGLQLIADDEPPRHANIRGWPTLDDPDLQKNKRRLKAAALAEESKWLSP